MRNPDSLTGKYLSGQLTIPVPARRREPGSAKEWIALRGRARNNLQGLDVEIPLGMLACDHGRFGLGEIDAGARCALSRAVAPAGQG